MSTAFRVAVLFFSELPAGFAEIRRVEDDPPIIIYNYLLQYRKLAIVYQFSWLLQLS